MPRPRADATPPTIFVLFGATGDLAHRMVLPAFYDLARRDLLPERWLLVGNGRGDVAHEDFRRRVHDSLVQFGPEPAEPRWSQFAERLLFAGGGFDSHDPGNLLDVLAQASSRLGGDVRHVHYFAVPPAAFGPLTEALGSHGLAAGSRVVYEKPYGTSPEKFRQLDDLVHSVLHEDQVFRIDHFLGKEATQDLHVTRFANGLLAGSWHRDRVAEVQIDVPETLDVAHRAQFYDATGAILDMLVTHLLQVAAEVAMEPPASMAAPDLQAARESVLAAFRPLRPADVVLGQVDGYRDLDGVAPGSRTETFVAARLWVDTDRWHGVPFLLRTGKRLARSAQRVSLVLRRPDGPVAGVPDDAHVLSFSLSGSGEIDLSLVAKRPGPDLEIVTGTTSLRLEDLVGEPLPPYVSLLHDVLVGDRSLFTSAAGLASAWRVVQPLLADRPAPRPYRAGTMGPQAASDLIAPSRWLLDGPGPA